MEIGLVPSIWSAVATGWEFSELLARRSLGHQSNLPDFEVSAIAGTASVAHCDMRGER